MQIFEIGERLCADERLSPWEVRIIAPGGDTGFVTNGQNRVLVIHRFKVGVDGKIAGATDSPRKPIVRDFLDVSTAGGRHDHARDELVIKTKADQFARNREGKTAPVALVLAVCIAVENARNPHGVYI